MTDDPLFALGTFADGLDAFAGLVVNGGVVDLRPALGAEVTTLALLHEWDDSLVRLAELAADPGLTRPIDELRPLPPVASQQILCAGANYHRHLRQMAAGAFRADDPGASDQEIAARAEEQVSQMAANGTPFVFAGLPSALCGANDDVVLAGPGVQHDWELELAVIIGRRADHVSREQAMDHVAGYTICNDISTRDVMNRPNFPMTDFLMSKCRPTFFPTGPYLVPRATIPDPTELRITLKVNGTVMQDESVSDIIFGVDRIVEQASKITVLSPGDLILTGSPAGNAGHHGGRWLVAGDVMEGEITGLGRQRNVCVSGES